MGRCNAGLLIGDAGIVIPRVAESGVGDEYMARNPR